MRHVYLSPHLDDAVLSCGGAIARHAAEGEPVQVITVVTEDVEDGAILSPFAQDLHRQWGHPRRPFGLRRVEDLAAFTLLGAETRHLDYLDAIYRTDGRGQWTVTDNATLFGEVSSADPLAGEGMVLLAERLAGLLAPPGEQALYAPLAVGRHVDHQIVHAAARWLQERGYGVGFYEDYPYAEKPGAVEAALDAAGAARWRLEVLPLEARHVADKVAALGYHRSQMSILFGGAEQMPSRVWAFASTRSPDGTLAERMWWPPSA